MVAVEEVTQKDCGSNRIEMRFFGLTSGTFFQRLLRFPTCQSFISQLDGQAEFLLDARSKTGSFLSHFAGVPGEMQRRTNDDESDLVFARDFAKAADIFLTIFSFERGDGHGRDSEFIRDGQADAPPAIVNRQYADRFGGRRMRARARGSHSSTL